MIKIVLQILFVIAPILAIGQHHLNAKRVDLGVTQNFPMRNGKVWYTDLKCFSGCTSSGSVEIESTNDSVFSSCAGKVNAIFDLGDYKCIVVKVDASTFYSIIQLSSVVVKNEQFITKGTFIGKSKQDEEKRLYSIMYMVLDSSARYFSEEKIWELLKLTNEPECRKDEITYQVNQINHMNPGSDNFRTYK